MRFVQCVWRCISHFSSHRSRRQSLLQNILCIHLGKHDKSKFVLFIDFFQTHLFQFNIFLASPNCVNKSELHETPKDEACASHEPNLRCFNVADFRQCFALRWSECNERQHSCRSQHDARCCLIRLQPEGNPRNCDNHHRRQEIVNQVESHLSTQRNGEA